MDQFFLRRGTVVLIGAALLLQAHITNAQSLSADNLIHLASLVAVKADAFIQKKNFYLKENGSSGDTIQSLYVPVKQAPKKNKAPDTTERRLFKSVFKQDFFITYQTSSAEEYSTIRQGLKENGFYCNREAEADTMAVLLFQKDDMTAHIYQQRADSTLLYCFRIFKKDLPNPADIVYADDLQVFTSHEYLEYYFGKPNVKKDIFYLAGNDMVRCSVLLPNTPRQVVFIWADEVNKTGIANLLFGGQQRLQSAMQNGGYVGESAWKFKSGIHAGMTLYELRKLNGNNFKFYGGNSPKSGAVVPDKTGRLDFRREDVVLSCINCNDSKFFASNMLDADEAIDDGRIVFVLSVILNPNPSSIESLP
jgi:hypothetical protein